MDRITLNGEVYVKESSMEKLSDDNILKLLRESSIEVCDIAEVLKDKLGKCLEDGLWIDTDEVDRRPQKVREVVLYMALDDYC